MGNSSVVDRCDRRTINFAPASGKKAKAFRAGSKSAVTVECGMRPGGVSLYRVARILSERDGSQWGSAVSPAYARAWLAPSYLGAHGYGVESEHKTVADYLAGFKGDELAKERAAIPEAALKAPAERTLLVVRVLLPKEGIDAGRPDVAPATPAAKAAPAPAASTPDGTPPNMAKAKAKAAAKRAKAAPKSGK